MLKCDAFMKQVPGIKLVYGMKFLITLTCLVTTPVNQHSPITLLPFFCISGQESTLELQSISFLLTDLEGITQSSWQKNTCPFYLV